MSKVNGYMVVIMMGREWWTYARLGRDGLLYRSNANSLPIKMPTVFTMRAEAEAAIAKTKKQAWARRMRVRFRLIRCAVVLP